MSVPESQTNGQCLTSGERCICGFQLPPVGQSFCAACGLELERHQWEPYPATKVERYDWLDRAQVGDGIAKAVLKGLVSHDKSRNATPGRVTPSVARLVSVTEFGERTIRRKLRELGSARWITINRRWNERGDQLPSEYVIHHPRSGCIDCRSDTPPLPERQTEGESFKGESRSKPPRQR